jgi:hypothetical protein
MGAWNKDLRLGLELHYIHNLCATPYGQLDFVALTARHNLFCLRVEDPKAYHVPFWAQNVSLDLG